MECVCKCGSVEVWSAIEWCCRREKLTNVANSCKTTSPYFPTGRIPVMMNYVFFVFVVAGLKWMASSVFVTVLEDFFSACLSLLESTQQIHKTNKKIRNCTDSLIFIHSSISFRCSAVWLPINKCLCEFPDLYSQHKICQFRFSPSVHM